jgi:hypothetical protein
MTFHSHVQAVHHLRKPVPDFALDMPHLGRESQKER